MGGAIFGNVISPLADTSVLSALISHCDMLEHITSQITYAFLVGLLCVLLSACNHFFSASVALILGLVIVVLAPLAVAVCAPSLGSRHYSTWIPSWIPTRRSTVSPVGIFPPLLPDSESSSDGES